METKKSIFLLSAIPVGLIAVALSISDAEFTSAGAAVLPADAAMMAHPSTAPTADAKTRLPKRDYDFTSGPRSIDELDEEWQVWTGGETMLNVHDLEIKEPMHLVGIVSEFQDLSKNPLRILHISSLGQSVNQKTETVTLYNRQIDGLEEKTLNLALVVPHKLVPTKAGLPDSIQAKSYFSVHMQPSILKRPFDLRPPLSQGEFAEFNGTDFDPLQQFLTLSGGQKDEIETTFGDQTYSVQAEARESEFGTLIIELRIRALESLHTQRIALLYE